MRLAAALAALALLGWSLPAAGDPPEEAPGPASCPADGIRALGAPAARWLDRARQEGAGNPGCARKATLALQLLDADRPVDCGALDIAPGSSLTAADPDVSSLTAALAWRCGRPRAAHHAARAALAVDPDATLAWRVLGKVLAARFRPDAALAAYERAVALDPRDAQSLWGLAGLRHDRARRKETLRRFLEVAEARGETKERQRAAQQALAFLEALGERRVWTVERAEVPGKIDVSPLVAGPGAIDGYVARLSGGGRRRFTALVDSGASGLHLSPKIAKRLGIEPLAEAVLFGGGGEGEHAVSRGIIERLDLGPLIFGDAIGTVASSSLHRTGAYQAIIGLDVLSGLHLTLDGNKRELTVRKGKGPDSSEEPLEVEPFDVEGGWAPIVRVEGQLLVPISIHDGAHEERVAELLALLDTGASDTLLSLSAAEGRKELRLGGDRAGRGYGGEIAYHGTLAHADVELTGVRRRLRSVPVIELSERSRLAGIKVDAMIGWDLFGSGRLEIDLAAGRARLLPKSKKKK